MPAFALDGEIWEIQQDDKQLLITANGNQRTRTFVSAEKAAIQYGKLIAEKTAAGWTPSTAKAVIAPPPGEPREPELERAVLANPEDRDAWAIYADWYQQQQHPRGELIALQLGGERKLQDAATRHLARHKDVLLGPLARWVTSNGESPFTWRHGFIRGIAIANDGASVVKAVLAHPSGRFLESLDVQALDERELREALEDLACANATLREVRVRSSVALGQLRVFEGMQKLHTLSLETLAGMLFAPSEIRALTRLPASLTTLMLRIDADDDEWWPELAPLFAREDLHIAHLGVRIPALIEQILPAIATGPFAAQLESLDFSFTAPDVGLRALLGHRDRFAKLQEVTLSLGDVTTEVRQDLKKTIKRVIDARVDTLADEIGYEAEYEEIME